MAVSVGYLRPVLVGCWLFGMEVMVSNFKGTPGPWHWQGKVLCNDEHIVGGDGWAFNGVDKHLIASAPELLEALQDITVAIQATLRVGYERIIDLGGECDSVDVMIKGHSEIARAKAVIAKALGGSQ